MRPPGFLRRRGCSSAAPFLTVVAALLLAGLPDLSRAAAPGAPRLPGQLPKSMRIPMTNLPVITVGRQHATLVGDDHRALQAAVEYVAALGGGIVEIGPGEYLMKDSLHLRSHVTVRGTPGKTILRKAPAVQSPLAADGDFGEEQFTVENPDGFEVGSGVAIWDSQAQGFHLTVARIIAREGNTFAIDRPLMADCLAGRQAMAATIFPVVSGVEIEGARVEDLIIEGNRAENFTLDGCRGAGIYLYRGFGTVIARCTVRNYHGDGIGFQQSNDVVVEDCVSEHNSALGFHPGSGSQRPVMRRSVARHNGTDGLFLCWRVQHGSFEDNVLENNGRYGVSIGHKDTDNLLRRNVVRENSGDGVHFRNETEAMAGHRNRLEENVIENNGGANGVAGAGIRIRGATDDVMLINNLIRDTRQGAAAAQKYGIVLENQVGDVTLEGNQIQAAEKVKDERKR